MKIRNMENIKVSYIRSQYDNNKERKIELNDSSIKKDYNIEISDEGKKLLEKCQEAEKNQHMEKIDRIKNAIEKGTYKPSPEKIAGKMMEKIHLQEGSGKDD